MSGTGSGYDLSVTTFTPDGRVLQVQYAEKAVDISGTCLAVCCKDGVVMASEKLLLSKLLVDGTNRRTAAIDKHIGMVSAGFTTDARQILDRARGEASSYKSNYDEKIPPFMLAERLGLFVHQYTLYWSVRPFGASVLVGSYSKDTKPSLHCIEPSGLVFKYFGKALGKGKQLANTEVEKLKLSELTCKEVLFYLAKIMHKVHDEKDKDFELECSWITDATNYQFELIPRDVVQKAQEEAKKAIEEEDEDDD
eukprot:GEMP01045102.1.p1 GENE.GEMP01045102.1~~GEMP01045102.1.p1  ORF type:complete len:252 (+),score=56.14 GEMP01045102.1:46-801(+)